MALQDLTPQLRTRLSRMEKAVGWFVLIATALLVAGFFYYIYQLAERKGWFLTKAPYFVMVQSAAGLHVGDPVMLMGFAAGSITEITPLPAEQFSYNVYVQFVLKAPNYGYIWTAGSLARVTTADLLGKRQIEVTKGTGGYPTYTFHPLRVATLSEARSLPNPANWLLAQEIDTSTTNFPAWSPLPKLDQVAAAGYTDIMIMDKTATQQLMTGIWSDEEGRYQPYVKGATKGYWLKVQESPAAVEQLQGMLTDVQHALPGVFSLTNQIAGVLSNTTALASNLNATVLDARPMVSNLAAATAHLDQPGALGQWLLPTNLNKSLDVTLDSANALLASSNTNLNSLVQTLGQTLNHMANITSNLDLQVQSNSNILATISKTVTDADEFVQGLKRFWLLRSVFKSKQQPEKQPAPFKPLLTPKAKGER